jgi:hypothetical protein
MQVFLSFRDGNQDKAAVALGQMSSYPVSWSFSTPNTIHISGQPDNVLNAIYIVGRLYPIYEIRHHAPSFSLEVRVYLFHAPDRVNTELSFAMDGNAMDIPGGSGREVGNAIGSQMDKDAHLRFLLDRAYWQSANGIEQYKLLHHALTLISTLSADSKVLKAIKPEVRLVVLDLQDRLETFTKNQQ